MRQYVQTDLEVHRQVATAPAELILGGVMAAPDSPAVRNDGPRCGWLSQGLVHYSVHIREKKSPGAIAPRL